MFILFYEKSADQISPPSKAVLSCLIQQAAVQCHHVIGKEVRPAAFTPLVWASSVQML